MPQLSVVIPCYNEVQTIEDVAPLTAGESVLWDRRFRLALTGEAPALVVRALMRTGVQQLRSGDWSATRREVPAPVRPGLPAVWLNEELVAVPHLGLIRPWLARCAHITAQFKPASPVAGTPFHADFAAA